MAGCVSNTQNGVAEIYARLMNQTLRTGWGEQAGMVPGQNGQEIGAGDDMVLAELMQDMSSGNVSSTDLSQLNQQLNGLSSQITSFNQGQYPGPMFGAQDGNIVPIRW